MQKKKVIGFILMLIATLTISFGGKTTHAAGTPKLMVREGGVYVSESGDVYYAIGAGRSGNTKYTADLINSITFVTNKNVPSTAEASWDVSYTSGDGEVIAWVIPNSEDSTKYDLYIGADSAQIEAPSNSYGLFRNYTNCASINNLKNLATQNATNAGYMFFGCNALTSLDLKNFVTSNITYMHVMFGYCTSLVDLDLTAFDTSKVISMKSMFDGSKNIVNLNLSSFNTENVTDMSIMFYNCNSLTNLNLDNFDTSKVTNMEKMFYYCTSLTNINLNNFNTSNVTNMGSMFYKCNSLTNLNLNNFDTSKVTDMNNMFFSCNNLTSLDISSFRTSKVTNMGSMFRSCSSLTSLDLRNFDTTSSPNMVNYLLSTTSLKTLVLGSKVTNLIGSSCINKCDSLKAIIAQSATPINLGDSVNYANSTVVLYVPSNLEEEYNADQTITSLFSNGRIKPILALKGPTTDNGTLNVQYEDKGATVAGMDDVNEYGKYGYELTSTNNVNTSKQGTYEVTYTLTYSVYGESTPRTETVTRTVKVNKPVLMAPTSANIFGSSFDKSTVTRFVILNSFANAPTSYIENGKWDISETGYEGSVYAYLTLNNDGTTHTLYVVASDTIEMTVGLDMFSHYTNCTSIEGMEYLNTSKITDMSWMFCDSSSITSIDISMFDTSNVTNMEAMFSNCTSLTSVNMKGIDTSKVEYMGKARNDSRGMFQNCTNLLSVDFRGMNTSSLKSMNSMFLGCTAIESINMSNLNLDKVTDMKQAFNCCENVVDINLTGTTARSITNMEAVFKGCTRLEKLDLSGFDTSNVTTMLSLFESNSALVEIKGVENFNTSKATDMRSMFSDCTSLTSLNLSKFDTTSADISFMFVRARALKTILLGPKFSSLKGGSIFNENNSLITIFAQSKNCFSNFELNSYYYGTTSTNLYVPNASESLYEADSNILSKFGANRIRAVLELVGDEKVNIGLGSTYVDAGATVGGFDKANESYYTQYGYNLTSTSNVNTSKKGEYTVTYTLTYNVDGESTPRTETVTRTVSVGRPVLMAPTSANILGSSFSKNTVTKMIILNSFANAPTSYIENGKWDVSADESKGSVYAYLTLNNDGSTHTLYIVAGDIIKVTVGCDLFSHFSKLTSIEGMEYLDTSIVKDMSWMFCDSSSMTSIDISMFDTSNVTNMEAMFSNCTSLTSVNMKGIDTSKVEYMGKSRVHAKGMFEGCTSLKNIDMTSLDTSSLVSTNSLFKNCKALTTIDLSDFNTSNVTDMADMFSGCSNLTAIILDKGITSSDQAMKLLTGTGLDSLSNAVLYVSDVASEKLYEKATNYSTAFKHSKDTSDDLYRIRPLLEIAGENPAKARTGKMYDVADDAGVTIAGFGKANASEYTQYGYNYTTTGLPVDTSSVGTKQVTYTLTKTENGTTTNGMTATRDVKVVGTPKLMNGGAQDIPVGNQFTTGAIGASRSGNIKYTSYSISTITFVTNKNVPSTAEASWDVSYTSGDGEVIAWVIPNASNSNRYDLYIGADDTTIEVSSASFLFNGYGNCTAINNLTMLDTSNTTSMHCMFQSCSSLTSLDVSNFDTSNVTDMSSMFYKCSNLSSLNLGNFNTSNVTDMSSMFSKCSSLTSLNLGNFNTSNVTDMSSMFSECSSLTNLDLNSFNTSKVTDMSFMFNKCSNLSSLNLNNFDTSSVTNMRAMFQSCNNLKNLNLSSFNTSKVTDMSFMFNKCSNLSSLNLNNFDTSSVTNMRAMFQSCNNLKNLNLSSFNTSNVTDMGYMFYGCSNITSLDVTNFDTSKVTNMQSMFSGCSNIPSLDVTNFDTSNVTNMGYMFSGCNNLPSLDVTNFDTSNVTSMERMFKGCSNITSLNLSSFDTSKVTAMYYMFNSCSNLTTLNISNFDTSKVTNMADMFSGCSNLTSIVLDKGITSSDQAMKLSTGTGLDSLSNAVLYVPDTSSEKLYEKATNYSTEFKHSKDTSDDLYRIRPLLEIAGENPAKARTGKMYDVADDAGVTIAGFGKANASEYTQYGYNYTTTGLPVDTSSVGTKQVTYTLTKTENGTTTNGMTATRDVKVVGTPKLMKRESSEHDSSSGSYIYYAIGAKRSGNKKYTADLIDTLSFVGNTNIPSTAEASWDVSYNSGDMQVLAWVVPSTKSGKYDLYIGANDTVIQAPENCGGMFNHYTTLTTINGLTMLDTGVVTNMRDMFWNCYELTNVDVSKFNTSNVQSFAVMFMSCKKLTSIDVSKFDTSSATDMSMMFYNCDKLTSIDVTNFDTSNVTNMQKMFWNCNKLTTLDLSNFNTSKVTNMDTMFYNDTRMKILLLGDNFDRLIGNNMFNNTSMSIVTTRTTPLTVDATTNLSSMSKVVLYVNNTTVETTFESDSSCSTQFGSDRIRPILEFVDGSKIEILIGQTYNNSPVTVAGRESAEYTAIGYTIEKIEDNVDATKSGTYNVTYRVLRNGTEIMRATQVVEVLKGNYCNVTTGAYYEILKNAVDAANNGDLIKVMEDVNDASPSDINVNKEITIDTNGMQVTLPYTIKNKSTLKIIGNGTINFAAKAGFKNYSVMTIEEATIKNVSGTEVVKNSSGTLTINSGNLIAGAESVIFNNASTVIINGGTITGTIKVAINNYGGELTVNGGNIVTNSPDQGLINNWNNGTTNIKGGKLSIGNTSAAVYVEGKLNISGGEINNTGTGVTIWNVGETSITGGKMTSTQRSCIYTGSSATVTLGTKDGNVSRETPMLISPNYTVHSDGTFNFYDGILKNNASSTVYYGTPNAEDNYRIYIHKTKDADGYYLAYPIYSKPMISEGTYDDVFVNKYIFKNSSTNRDNVLTITLHNEIPSPLPSGAWDISDNNSQSAYAWLTTSVKDSTKYDLHLAADGVMYASNAYGLFGGYANCTDINGLQYLDTSYATNFSSMFRADTSLSQLDLSSLDTSNADYMYRMFYGDTKLTYLDISNFNTSKVTSFEEMFYNCNSLGELDVSSFNTAKVTTMYKMFENCSSLVTLDLGTFNTSSMTEMSSMFAGCSKLTSLNVSTFDTSNITSMYRVFFNCSKLSGLDITNFNTSKLTTMEDMFYNCSSLTELNVDNLDVSKVTNMYRMFYNCSSLTRLDLSKFNTSSAIEMSKMFADCTSIESLDLTGFDTSKVTSMEKMFYNCNKLKSLNLGNFNTSNVTNVRDMFHNCSSLKSIYLGDGFDTTKVTSMYGMFIGCTNLTALILDKKITSADQAIKLLTGTGDVKTYLEDLSDIILYVPDEESEKLYEAATNYSTIFANAKDSNGDLYRVRPMFEMLGNNPVNVKVGAAYNETTDAGVTIAGFDKSNESEYTQYGFNYTVSGLPVITDTAGTKEVKYTLTETKNGTITNRLTLTRNVVIAKKNIANVSATLDETEIVYNGAEIKPNVTVKDGDTVLVEQDDYTLEYTNNINAGTASVKIIGCGEYDGEIVLTFNIIPADISGSIVIAGDCKYGERLSINTENIVPTNATLEYKWYVNTAKSTTGGTVINGETNSSYVIAKGMVGKYIYVEVTAELENYNTKVFKAIAGPVQATSVNGFNVVLSKDVYMYDGTAKTPEATVTDSRTQEKLTVGTDYTIEYKDNIAVGTAKVIIKGINDYTGEKEVQFKIIELPKVELVNLTPGWTNGSVSIEIKITNEGGGIGKVLLADKEISLDANNKATEAVTSNGLYTCKVYDIYNNVVTAELYVSNIDKKAPEITSVTYNNTVYVKNVNVEVKVTDTDSGVFAYAISTNSVAPTSWTNITSVENVTTFNALITANGTYYLYVKDVAGNITKYDNKIAIANIDDSVPVIRLFDITEDYTFTREVFIQINAEDDTGVESVLISDKMLTNSQVYNSTDWVPYTGTVLYTLPSNDGSYTLYAWVKDTVGNISEYAQDTTLLLTRYVGSNGTNSTSFKFLVKDENYDFNKKVTAQNIKLKVKDSSGNTTYSTDYGMQITSISLPVVYGPTQEGTLLMRGEYYIITVENIQGDGTVYLIFDANAITDKAGNKLATTEIETDVTVELNAPTITLGTTEIQVSDAENNLIQAIKINGKTVLLTGGKISYAKLKSDYGITLKTGDVIEAYDKCANTTVITVK